MSPSRTRNMERSETVVSGGGITTSTAARHERRKSRVTAVTSQVFGRITERDLAEAQTKLERRKLSDRWDQDSYAAGASGSRPPPVPPDTLTD